MKSVFVVKPQHWDVFPINLELLIQVITTVTKYFSIYSKIILSESVTVEKY